MLNLRKGAKVPFPDMLSEGFEVGSGRITANVSAEKIEAVMEDFIRMREEPVFFILELPTKKGGEEAYPEDSKALHMDVYYIDGCDKETALEILRRAGQLMIDDGLCRFGFGGHESQDEIMFGKYNVAVLFSMSMDKYRPFFEAHGIPEKEKLITAWDTFTQDHPGTSECVCTDGKDVYSVPDQLADLGIYKAETREE